MLKNLDIFFPLKGLAIYICAVALLATLKGVVSFEIFSKALASPSGYRVNNAPSASARNSLFLEIDNLIKVAIFEDLFT